MQFKLRQVPMNAFPSREINILMNYTDEQAMLPNNVATEIQRRTKEGLKRADNGDYIHAEQFVF